MNLNDYTKAALKTESRITSVDTNKNRLLSTLSILIEAGNMLDDLKKNIFYEKEIDSDKFFNHTQTLLNSLHSIEIYDKRKHLNQNELIDHNINVDPRIFHGVIGMATESTEMLEALYSYIETGELDKVNLVEEVGDSDWYEAILLDALGQDWEKSMDKNIKKLKKRYTKSQFSKTDAIDRDLVSEREILEE